MPNFVTVSQTDAEIGQVFNFQNGDRPPSWIRYAYVCPTHEEHLVVLIVAQTEVGIDCAVLKIGEFQ